MVTYFPLRKGVFSRVAGYVRAVDGVSFRVRRGTTLGLVGESGCGKTTLARTVLRLIPATSGRVVFDGRDFLALRGADLRAARRSIQVIFQDPVGSLNPRHSVETIVGEGMAIHRIARGRERRARVARLLERVGLGADCLDRYPHEFSGGQRQRIGIARALALDPKLVICDEPVSALDVSVQAQIINLLADLREGLGLSYLFIAHNLAVIEHFCDDVAVMYLGRIVETAPADQLYEDPRHPYTQALMSAVPEPDPDARGQRVVLGGEVPSPADPPSGCAFHPRCPLAEDRCHRERPELSVHEGCEPAHLAACHLADRMKPGRLAEVVGAQDSSGVAQDAVVSRRGD
ncbi:MAG: ATP-binding cassette domain-containing protein [Phycisphaerales bacterium]|nr:MAG: ATP-binding cassette domain-containing protein [Phycisphaerales bacterium]